MTTQINQSLATETKEAELEQRSQKLADHIEAKYFSGNDKSRPCVGLVWELTGANPHMAIDEIRDMKSSFTDLLAFLTDPEISQKFEKARDGNYNSKNFAKHLKRMLHFLNDADDKKVFAEMALFDLESFGFDEIELKRLESDFYK